MISGGNRKPANAELGTAGIGLERGTLTADRDPPPMRQSPAHLIRRLGRVLDDIDPDAPDDDDTIEIRRLLYGLHAILHLHFAQEDEGYLSLADDEPAKPVAEEPR